MASRWQIFKLWHKDEKFWREFYVRMLSSLGAAFVLLLVGILSGYITIHSRILLHTIVGLTFFVLWGLIPLSRLGVFYDDMRALEFERHSEAYKKRGRREAVKVVGLMIALCAIFIPLMTIV